MKKKNKDLGEATPENLAQALMHQRKSTEDTEAGQQSLSLPSETQLIKYTFEGELIHQRPIDGYINATEMCKAAGKDWSNYLKNASTQAFLDELGSVLLIRRTELIQTIQGGIPSLQGTWIHPDIAVNLAQWLSPRFAVFVSRLVNDWIRGSVKGYMPFHVGRYILNRRKIPHTHFSMLNEIYLELLAPLEDAGVRLTDNMMPDISTGRMFSDFLRRKGIDVDSCPRYEHEFLGNRQPVSARLYPIEFLAEFRRWFHEQWMPNRSIGYFQERLPPAVPVIKKIIVQLEHEPKKDDQPLVE